MTELTDEQINKRILNLMGLCQHKWEPFAYGAQTWYRCDCGDISSKIIEAYNFTGDWKTSAYEFGLMWEFMATNTAWQNHIGHYSEAAREYIQVRLISPRPFAEAMVGFFEEAKP